MNIKSIYPELALYSSKNGCARTDNVFYPISQVCIRGLTLKGCGPSVFYWVNGTTGKTALFFQCKILLKVCKMERPLLRSNKKYGAFFVNVSSGFSLSWNSFHRYHPASWLFVIIHVEKTFRAMTGEICGKYFKKKLKIRKHFWKQHEHFLIPSQRYKNFRYIYKLKKFFLMGSTLGRRGVTYAK